MRRHATGLTARLWGECVPDALDETGLAHVGAGFADRDVYGAALPDEHHAIGGPGWGR